MSDKWFGVIEYTEGDVDTIIDFNGDLTRVDLYHDGMGLRATAYSKLNPVDQYDGAFGMELALARAKARLFAKIDRKLSK